MKDFLESIQSLLPVIFVAGLMALIAYAAIRHGEPTAHNLPYDFRDYSIKDGAQ